jgi:predicted DsbA family dithiol-disulfide isomerase
MLRKSWLLAAICAVIGSAAFSQDSPKASPPVPASAKTAVLSSPKEPIAIVGGRAIYEEEMLPQLESRLQQLRNQEYELRKQVLDGLINQRLVEAEAARLGLTPLALLKQVVDSKISDPSDDEVLALYNAQKDRINRPFEEVKTQIRDAIKDSKTKDARKEYFGSLREKTEVSVLLKPPRTAMSFDPARVRGNAAAPVTIVEFSDFQCPFCLRAHSTVQSLLTKYDGRVKLAYRDFPLREIHPRAQMAAEASRCAAEQGKFWEYHDLLFANPGKLAEAALKEDARTLSLDTAQFDFCLDSGKFKPAIEEDLQAGTNAGVNGTPGFFINGIFLNGAQPAAEFEKIIDGELPKTLPASGPSPTSGSAPVPR